MKICFIHNLYAPYTVGGAERVVEGLVEDARRRGDEVVVITVIPKQTSLPERHEQSGCVIYRLKSEMIFPYQSLGEHGFFLKAFWHLQDIYSNTHALRIKKIIEKEQPDIVHTHNLMGVGFQVARAIHELNIPHHHTVHDVQLVEPSGILPWNHTTDSVCQKWHESVMRKRFAHVTEVIYPTVFMKEFYESRGFFPDARVTVTSMSFEKKVSSDIRTPLHKLLFVGSLVPHKGIDVLMQIWEGLPRDDVWELHIVGDGVLKEYVIAWAKQDHRVTVYGRLDKERVHELYDAVDVLLFTSTCIENRPNVIVEACEHGLPVIAAETGGVGELVSETLIEPGNVRAYIDAITKNELF